jgi:hypothetical protein
MALSIVLLLAACLVYLRFGFIRATLMIVAIVQVMATIHFRSQSNFSNFSFSCAAILVCVVLYMIEEKGQNLAQLIKMNLRKKEVILPKPPY